mmetsp:Transcript_40413/g.88361  ORF Transcript_40413/g.88361 Transcript_40413/m.88361 type:complete len:392 (+) Transcript_40413:115-1290(+)
MNLWLLISLALAAPQRAAAATAPNRRDKLAPPPGAVWRGSSIMQGEEDSPKLWGERYGKALHILRYFANQFPKQLIIPEHVIDFVRGGGILWYNLNMKETTWYSVARGDHNETIDKWAAQVASLKPHQVLVVPFHEPEKYLGEAGYYAEQYLQLWDVIQERFYNGNARNAIWGLNFVGKKEKAAWKMKAIWPGHEKVDWLFFNFFQTPCTGTHEDSFDTLCGGIYSALDRTDQDECGRGVTCNFHKVNWGIGAFGTASRTDCDKPAVPSEARATFFQTAADTMAQYPRLLAYVYFDAIESAVATQQMEQTGELDYSTKAAYMQYLLAPAFQKADEYWRAATSLVVPSGDGSGSGSGSGGGTEEVSGTFCTVAPQASVLLAAFAAVATPLFQ